MVIRPADAADVLAKALKHNAMEVEKFRKIENGSLDKSWVDETLAKKGCELIVS